MTSALWSAPPDDVWTGRTDGDGPEHARWHQVVRPVGPEGVESPEGVALLGFASDEGVRRNHGRPGAAQGPDAIRRALAPLAVHHPPALGGPALYDAGTIRVGGAEPETADLEGAQAALGAAVAALLERHGLLVVLGGGHEGAYGSFLGRRAAARTRAARTAVINLDAHFDLRDAPAATSGTPFRQMARDDAAAGREFRYTALGIAAAANTRALFAAADRLGATYLLDTACQPRHLDRVLAVVDGAIADAEAIHLSIDMDVLPAAVAPGVSAPAPYGVPMETLVAVAERVAASGRLVVVDVVEVAPPYDVDGHTARAAARLISAIVAALPTP